MKHSFKLLLLAGTFGLWSAVALAKLPAPSDEAKAKAAEASAKTAWAGKPLGASQANMTAQAPRSGAKAHCWLKAFTASKAKALRPWCCAKSTLKH